jgi:hypothetical protein
MKMIKLTGCGGEQLYYMPCNIVSAYVSSDGWTIIHTTQPIVPDVQPYDVVKESPEEINRLLEESEAL